MPRPSLLLASVVLLGAVGVATSPAVATSARHLGPSTAAAAPTARADAALRPEASASPPFAPRRVLVAPARGVQRHDLREVHARVGGVVERVLPGTSVREVRLPAGVPVRQAVDRYERAAAVRFAEPDYLLRASQAEPLHPDDADFEYLYGMHNTGQYGGTPDADIDAPEAWAVTTGRADTVVAVIDTGVDIDHPDLADNRWTNPGEVPGNHIDDDANGYVDDVHGWDFYHRDNTVADGDEDAHGTHVAGTIAARGGNGIGVAGVSWRAQIMPLKFLGAEGGFTSDAIAALDYAVANGARISNNSWGGPDYSQALQQAIERAGAAGHLFVTAAGNGGDDGLGDDNDLTADYPASYPSDNIVAVAATDDDDVLAGFSNYGAAGVDLAAPGAGIYSTVPGNAYDWYWGTSMAAPHVAGAAALLQGLDPALDALDVKARLLDTTDPHPSLQRTVSGGRLNVGRAVDIAAATTLTLANSPATLRFGRATTLAGRLAAQDQGLEAKTVVLQQRPVGSTRWVGVPDGLRTTGADGAYGMTGVSPSANTDYRAHYAGEPRTEASVSPVLRTNVRVGVSLVTPARDLRLGRSRAVSGEVRPAHSGSVRLVVRRNDVVVARKVVALTDSRYRFSFRPRRPGAYTFRTLRYADDDHLGGRSPTRGFRVVR